VVVLSVRFIFVINIATEQPVAQRKTDIHRPARLGGKLIMNLPNSLKSQIVFASTIQYLFLTLPVSTLKFKLNINQNHAKQQEDSTERRIGRRVIA